MKTRTIMQKLIQSNMEAFWQLAATTNHLVVQSTPKCTYTVSSIPDALFNSVLNTKFGEDKLIHEINEIKNNYKKNGLSFCWWVSPNCSPDTLEDELVNQGFNLFGNVEGMAIEISGEIKPIFPENVTHTIAKTTTDFDDWIKPLATSFHMSESGANSYKNIFEDISKISQDIQHYVAYYDGKPVASSTLFFDNKSKSAGIYNCATMPEVRNKGIASALTQLGLLSAQQNGYKTAVLQASPMSKGLFEKAGFEEFIPYKVYLG